MSPRLGVLGGTFNPVHVGHVRLALEMAEALGLDGVEIVPAARPPHKPEEGLLPFELRLRLLEMALGDLEGVRANSMEAGRPGPSYTVHTLEELARRRPGDELHFILGSGDLLTLHQWRDGHRLGDLAHLAVAGRDRHGRDAVADYLASRPELGYAPAGPGLWERASGRRLVLVDVPRLDISASFVRDRFRRGSNLRFLLPPAVERELARLRPRLLEIWRERAPSPSVKAHS
ncbi:putative nicotinate-nucleotide adenylyltransferase [Fundidesulfovibrio magnetotacticus]|uniref:Probable nicotinate-nucleotide adenylyltransferase n=1 Tax=Fundidesulfovibrio magnetotacticus TaxID=2730080 RepID=A0A6V8LTL8_9BACT|nr:nicotinate (nicotinamide) nucleotide adenylyltransferase [Fundidesulfovibrio magnetotacticus]GFK94280.1 putative nicotinate-nucleotide adenylyltransferase [Fundidesulfovibrio magnetotacticus]